MTPTPTHRLDETVNGVYALVIRLTEDTLIKAGALGEIYVKKGMYIYVGSAQTNLDQRVRRHLRSEKRFFWHIDYFLSSGEAKIDRVLIRKGEKATECDVANEVGKRGEPILGFGCSDCHCKSHLFRVDNCGFLMGQMHEYV